MSARNRIPIPDIPGAEFDKLDDNYTETEIIVYANEKVPGEDEA